MKKALIIGIDDYTEAPLKGCVNDAIALNQLLERNGDGSPNFHTKLLTSNSEIITTELLHDSIAELFSGDANIALLYFAGHGLIDPITNSGFIVSQDGRRPNWGLALHVILDHATRAYPHIKATVIILDSCHSGYLGEISAINQQASVIGSGVTILTACHRDGTASESSNGHGIFTEMLLDGLAGSSADVCGQITPASVYSHIDQTLGPWEQRPVYKANVDTFVTLRQVQPKVALDILRRLPEYFPDPTHELQLDPSFEPNRDNVPAEIMDIQPDPDNTRIFGELQKCNRHGLVVPVGTEHMYYAAIESRACKLTALGAHYRKLAEAKKL